MESPVGIELQPTTIALRLQNAKVKVGLVAGVELRFKPIAGTGLAPLEVHASANRIFLVTIQRGLGGLDARLVE